MRALSLVMLVSLVPVAAGCGDEEEDVEETDDDESSDEDSEEDEPDEEEEVADEAEPDEENLQLDLADMEGETVAEEPAGDSRHIAHILIRYRGADRAPATITRSMEEAQALAEQAHERVTGEEEFADVARELGEDATKEHGGDLGTITRGLLPDALDDTAFSLEVGQISDVVETPLGFHVVKRLE